MADSSKVKIEDEGLREERTGPEGKGKVTTAGEHQSVAINECMHGCMYEPLRPFINAREEHNHHMDREGREGSEGGQARPHPRLPFS